jgi:hypothetical protein
MSIGGGSQKQKQSSSSTGESFSYGSDIWGAQSPFLQDLYTRANATTGDQGGINLANQYMGTAGANLANATNSLTESNQAMRGFLNPGQDPAAAAYARDLGQQFNEQFMPGLKGDAALAGGLGGSRQQIGAALGAQRGMQELSDFTANIYNDQQNRALTAAQGLSGNAQGFESLAGTGATLADFARSMPWYQLAQYSGLLGSPTSIDKGGYSTQSSTGQGSGSGWNAKFGWSS